MYGVDQLTDYTGYLLRTAFLKMSVVSARHFEPGTHPRDAGVLIALLSGGPVSQQELATRLNVNRTVMVKLIDSLEQRGLVERVRNPENRRAYALQPTPAGREALLELLPRMDERRGRAHGAAGRRRRRAAQGAAARADRVGAARAGPAARLPAVQDAPPLPRPCRSGARAARAADPPLRALKTLAGGVPSQRELADRLSVSGPVVVEMVDALEAKGYVERRRDPNDRRSNAVVVTPAGEEVVRDLTKRLSAASGELTAPIGIEGDRELRSLLRKLLGVT